MCLLVPRDDIDACTIRQSSCVAQRRTASGPNTASRSTPIAYNTFMVPWSIACANAANCVAVAGAVESHILGTTCIWILISPYQKVILVSRDARIQDNVDRVSTSDVSLASR